MYMLDACMSQEMLSRTMAARQEHERRIITEARFFSREEAAEVVFRREDLRVWDKAISKGELKGSDRRSGG